MLHDQLSSLRLDSQALYPQSPFVVRKKTLVMVNCNCRNCRMSTFLKLSIINLPTLSLHWVYILRSIVVLNPRQNDGVSLERIINTNKIRLSCMKLRVQLKNLKGVLAIMWFNIATSVRSPFFGFSWDRRKLFVDSTAVETFVSQVVTWPAATRVFLLTENEGRREKACERGWVRCPWTVIISLEFWRQRVLRFLIKINK